MTRLPPPLDATATPRALASTVLRMLPRRTAVALCLMVLVSMTEGLTVVLLLPLLEAAGVPVGGGAGARVAEVAGSLLSRLGTRPSLASMLGLYVVVVSAQATLSRAQLITVHALQDEVGFRMRDRLYRALAGARWSFLARTRSSDLVHALTAECDRVRSATGNALGMAAALLTGLVYLALALRVSAPATAAALTCGGLLLLVVRGQRAASHRAGRGLTRAGAEVLSAATEQVQGIKAVKSFGAEAASADRFTALAREARARFDDTVRAFANGRVTFTVGSTVLLAIVLWLAIAGLGLPPALAILLIFLFSRLVPRFSDVQQTWQGMLQDLPAYASVAQKVADAEAAHEPTAAGPAPRLEDAVRLEGVFYSHDAERGEVLRGLDLEVPARRTTAVVGPSGAGKTTVADLVIGLVFPGRGRVTVDGADLSPETAVAWRGGIGYVAQETTLFHDTVLANVRWSRPDATDEEVREALRTAAADFVDRLPAGLETVVGDRGLALSGGERQRLALARALLRRPSLLVLDEATSALDSESERRILEALDALHGRTTILLITHRLATARRADRVYVLEAGRVAEAGSWDELIERPDGRLRLMWEAQEASGRREGEEAAAGEDRATSARRGASSLTPSGEAAPDPRQLPLPLD